MRPFALNISVFAAILGLGCLVMVTHGKADEHCEDSSDPRYDASECEEGNDANKLEKTKIITANFKPSFSLPPRTVKDITKILFQQEREDRKHLIKMRKIADLTPPETDDKGDLGSFYFRRGEAASHLGRGKQAIADYRKAADLTITDYRGSHTARMATHNYALEQLLYGNYGDGIRGMVESLEHSNSKGQQLGRLVILAGLHAQGGEIEIAKDYLSQINNLISVVYNWPDMDAKSIETLFDNARSFLLAAEGKTTEAEALLRKTIKTWDLLKTRNLGMAIWILKLPGACIVILCAILRSF